jgi:gluconolactonase
MATQRSTVDFILDQAGGARVARPGAVPGRGTSGPVVLDSPSSRKGSEAMNRRDVLTGAGAFAAGGPEALGGGLPLGPLPGTRYPDPRIEALDPRFKAKIGNAGIERIATGFRWAEGPVYFRDGGYLLWSDIPNNRMLRWLEEDGHVSVFRSPSHYANGNTRDREGRLVTCEHDTRRVTRTEPDGRITVLLDRFEGKPLNAPNDVVVASDGGIWFTDPGYGIDGHYEGTKAAAELPTRVYRLDPGTGRAAVMVEDMARPNGLAFSPDERSLYVVDSAAGDGRRAHIRAFAVEGSRLTGGRVFADDVAPGITDGLRTDEDGNVWCSMGWADPAEDGVRCYAPDGSLIGKIHLPETCANLCFGGLKRNRLFMTASTSVYALYVDAQGAQRP